MRHRCPSKLLALSDSVFVTVASVQHVVCPRYALDEVVQRSQIHIASLNLPPALLLNYSRLSACRLQVRPPEKPTPSTTILEPISRGLETTSSFHSQLLATNCFPVHCSIECDSTLRINRNACRFFGLAPPSTNGLSLRVRHRSCLAFPRSYLAFEPLLI